MLRWADVKSQIAAELAKLPKGTTINFGEEVRPRAQALLEAGKREVAEAYVEQFEHLRRGFSNRESTNRPPESVKRIGVVLVHGIGEQKRFEHADAEIRQIVKALEVYPDGSGRNDVTVEIRPSPAGLFKSEQDAWMTGQGGTVRAILRDPATNQLTHIHFHEV